MEELIKRMRDSEHEIDCSLCDRDCCYPDGKVHGKCIIIEASDAIEGLSVVVRAQKAMLEKVPRWIPVTERLPECDLGAEVGNIEWISCGRVYAGCFGRGGKYRDAYFRTWTDAGEGMDANGADYWRTVTLPEPLKEETE